MRYATLGTSGVQVSRICFGTATLGVAPLEKDVPALIDGCLELGVNFIDTSNSYGYQPRFDRPGAPPADQRLPAEELLGNALKGRRDDFIVASKVMEPVGPGVNDRGLSRVHMMRQIEQSLRRLQTDHLDLYYAHHPDPNTPIETTVRVFDDLVRQGKIRYWALSTFSGARVIEALWAAERLGAHPPVAHQLRYNLDTRDVELDALPASVRHGLGVNAFSPLAGGLLAGSTTATREIGGAARWGGRGHTEEQIAFASKLDALAGEWGIPSAQLALCWLLSRPGISAAIIGPETFAELTVNAAAADLDLEAEQLAQIDALNPSKVRGTP